jgi:uncharacterized membrane protein YdbT with pleckstrin-like domain
MVNQDILNYINTESSQGQSKDAIVAALVAAGWQQDMIAEAYQTLYPTTSTVAATSATGAHATEKEYPITLLWIFKVPIMMFIVMAIGFAFNIVIPYLVIAFPIYLIANPLIRYYFHYSVEDKYLVVNQGVIKRSQRNLPYGVIQNVFVKQDLFDRIFGLASLRIMNASAPGQKPKRASFRLTGLANDQSTANAIGSSGNKLNIPGLKKQHAESLRDLILQKMKENPLEDNLSGL